MFILSLTQKANNGIMHESNRIIQRTDAKNNSEFFFSFFVCRVDAWLEHIPYIPDKMETHGNGDYFILFELFLPSTPQSTIHILAFASSVLANQIFPVPPQSFIH